MSDMTIRQVREQAGLTQQNMADKLGISRQAYAAYESHPERVTIEQARRICSILGAEYERIFFGKFAS
jgi:DNA-binding XRE family transcriptional regulator